jgi:hypothetical protein
MTVPKRQRRVSRKAIRLQTISACCPLERTEHAAHNLAPQRTAHCAGGAFRHGVSQIVAAAPSPACPRNVFLPRRRCRRLTRRCRRKSTLTRPRAQHFERRLPVHGSFIPARYQRVVNQLLTRLRRDRSNVAVSRAHEGAWTLPDSLHGRQCRRSTDWPSERFHPPFCPTNIAE